MWIIAGQDLQHVRDVFCPAGQRTNRIKGPTDRNNASIADAAHRRSQTADPIQRRRDTHRPARIRADGDQGHIRRNGRTRAPAGTAGNARRIPGVMTRAIMRIARRSADGPLVHIQLAQNNGARLAQARDDLGIGGRNMIPQERRPPGQPNPSDFAVVLQRNGNAVERPEGISRRHRLFRSFGRIQRRVRRDGEIGIQSRVERFDTVEVGLNELYRRELAGPNQTDNIRDAQLREIRGGHLYWSWA